MTQNLSSYAQQLHEYYQSFLSNPFTSLFCSLVLPVFDPLDFAVQLPINVLLIATLPFRFMFCMLFDTQVNFKCVIFNMFPFLSIFCPLLSTHPPNCQQYSNQCCYQACQELGNSSNPIIQFFNYVCNYCPQSLFNFISCVMSYMFLDVLSPILILLYPIYNLIGVTPPCLFPTFNCYYGEPS